MYRRQVNSSLGPVCVNLRRRLPFVKFHMLTSPVSEAVRRRRPLASKVMAVSLAFPCRFVKCPSLMPVFVSHTQMAPLSSPDTACS